MSLHVNWLSPFKRCFAKILTCFVKIWLKTLRIEIDEQNRSLLQQHNQSAKICGLWHNRLFVASRLFERYFRGTQMYGLISPSKDGAWLTEIYRNIGIHAVRGSTKRGGQTALRLMVDILREGHTVTITPDGPRGPKYIVKSGIAALAKETNVPIILAGIKIHKAWRINSWDQFYLPKPFSRVSVKFCVIDPKDYTHQTIEEFQNYIQNTLYGINTKNNHLPYHSRNTHS